MAVFAPTYFLVFIPVLLSLTILVSSTTRHQNALKSYEIIEPISTETRRGNTGTVAGVERRDEEEGSKKTKKETKKEGRGDGGGRGREGE